MWHARCEIVRHATAESCILSTRIVTSIYHDLGVPCVPIVVGAIGVNEAGWEKWRTGEQPWIGDDEGSFAIRINHEYEDDASKWQDEPDSLWPAGHIVLAAAGQYLVDPSADQMGFPDKGLDIPPLVIDLGDRYEDFVHGDYQPQITTQEGAHLQYLPYPDDTSYVHSSDWQTVIEGDPLFDRVVAQVMGLMDMVDGAESLPPLPDLPRALRRKDVGSPEFVEMMRRSMQEIGPVMGPPPGVSDSEVSRRRAERLYRGR